MRQKNHPNMAQSCASSHKLPPNQRILLLTPRSSRPRISSFRIIFKITRNSYVLGLLFHILEHTWIRTQVSSWIQVRSRMSDQGGMNCTELTFLPTAGTASLREEGTGGSRFHKPCLAKAELKVRHRSILMHSVT